jgi:phosphatidate cytidylyltransferase
MRRHGSKMMIPVGVLISMAWLNQVSVSFHLPGAVASWQSSTSPPPHILLGPSSSRRTTSSGTLASQNHRRPERRRRRRQLLFVTTPDQQQEQQEQQQQQQEEQQLGEEKQRAANNTKTNTTNRSPLSKLLHIYTDYAGRLWDETSIEARERMTASRLAVANKKSQEQLLVLQQRTIRNGGDSYVTTASTNTNTSSLVHGGVNGGVNDDDSLRKNAATAVATAATSGPVTATTTTATAVATIPPPLAPVPAVLVKKPRRSIAFGAAMGLVVTTWVFSGNYIFTLLFTLMTILGQLEYYRMVMSTGVYPARRISVVGACSMFLTALFTPDLHQICLPLFGCYAMIWFLTMKRSPTTIPEIATTFTGMFYLGYVPSFWVRLRIMGSNREPTRLASIAGPVLRYLQRQGQSLPHFVPSAIHLPVTSGAIFIFWTWLCLAFNDVGAYFVGRKFGRTKLGVISPAAAATSPNKTIEGLIGGCAVSAMLAIFGAWVQRWPFPILSGAVHGIILGLLGLIGDLSASMLKRDAGIKDFGDLIPEHGGIMDRVDGFIWTAPYS